MLGGAEEWFDRGLGGIDLDMSRAKDERITIRPRIVNGVDWVKCSYDSRLGVIRSSWKRTGDTLTIDITVPANASATVWIPLNNGKAPSSVNDAPGVVVVKRVSDGVVYRVVSGSYRFVLKNA